jgi:hypothetical protein
VPFPVSTSGYPHKNVDSTKEKRSKKENTYGDNDHMIILIEVQV